MQVNERLWDESDVLLPKNWPSFYHGTPRLAPHGTCIGDQGRDAHESNLRDVRRRYAEVTSSDEVIAYLERIPQPRPGAVVGAAGQ